MTAWDVEFSLALHNRTGKYHIGRSIIEDNADLVGDIYFWRLKYEMVPTGLRARVIGKLMQTELRARQIGRWVDRSARLRTARPMLHLDPFTVALHGLHPDDMVLCHDLGPITHPDLFASQVVQLYHRAYGEIAGVGPRMVFVSEASRAAFETRFHAHQRSTVIYPPIRADLSDGADAGADAPDDVTGPFLLTVGSIGSRKNQATAIRAYARTGLAAAGIGYVICGSREPGYEEVAKLATATPGVHLLPHVSDRTLAWLYGNASGFVLASRLEGFGMPVAEAIGYGLVPLVSEASVLEEVAGPGALSADPADEAKIARAMVALCEMEDEERAARQAKLQAAIQRFTPEAFRQNWRRALA